MKVLSSQAQVVNYCMEVWRYVVPRYVSKLLIAQLIVDTDRDKSRLVG